MSQVYANQEVFGHSVVETNSQDVSKLLVLKAQSAGIWNASGGEVVGVGYAYFSIGHPGFDVEHSALHSVSYATRRIDVGAYIRLERVTCGEIRTSLAGVVVDRCQAKLVAQDQVAVALKHLAKMDIERSTLVRAGVAVSRINDEPSRICVCPAYRAFG